ncbi:MAG TPA: class I SAM-dependent methyltransferase [Acidimicrobiales bacterium]|nr:class I SAM-dependent methyltransferase [Acidimicrobiales bacterium]
MPLDERSSFADRSRLGRAGFESGSEIYDRARPGYPEEAVAHMSSTLGIVEGSLVLDLAAGTGKLTRQLQTGGTACVAVEPSASMRGVFGRATPGIPMVAGTAESIPVAGGAMDAVVVAQAFHWFDAPTALSEIARVLRVDGGVALVWNERDESDPAIAELVRISKWDQCHPYPVGRDFGADIDESRLFGPVSRTKFRFTQYLDRTAFVEQVASRSYVQVLPEHERNDLLGQVAAFGSTLGDPIAMPYVTDLFCARVAS